jgi:hypothetical protein
MLAITYVTPAGGCQEGSNKVDTFGRFVDILAVGNLDFCIKSFEHTLEFSFMGVHGQCDKMMASTTFYSLSISTTASTSFYSLSISTTASTIFYSLSISTTASTVFYSLSI